MASLTLRFRAVPHVHVSLPAAVRAARHHHVGKHFKEPTEPGAHGTWESHEHDETVVLPADAHQMEDRHWFRRAVLEGELLCADEPTANTLGVPWKPLPAAESVAATVHGGQLAEAAAPPHEDHPAAAADPQSATVAHGEAS